MWSLRKKAITEEAAAALCIDAQLQAARDWPPKGLIELAELRSEKDAKSLVDALSAPETAFESAMACLALECLALRNLFPPDQARRVRRHVERLLATPPDIGAQALAAFRAYSVVAGRSTESLVRGGVALEFSRRVGIQADGIFLSFLDANLLSGLGIWKNLRENYRLVP